MKHSDILNLMDKWLIPRDKLECGASGCVYFIDTGNNALLWTAEEGKDCCDIKMFCKDIQGNVITHHFDTTEICKLNKSFYALAYNWLEPTMGTGDAR